MNLMELSAAVGNSEPFTTEQNDAVYQRLVSGDALARDEMIEGNVALVVYRVDAYLRNSSQMNYYRDDLIGAGLVGLCMAVDRMKKRGRVNDPKPTGYITREVDHEIAHAADESNTIVVSFQDQYEAKAKGEPIHPPRIISDKVLLTTSDMTHCNEIKGIDLHDEILGCCRDETDREIIRLRLVGNTQEEIGVILSIDDSTVSRRCDAMEKRLLERCPEYKETQRALAKKAEKKAKQKK